MRRLDHDRFFGTMGRVCLSAEKWMGSGVTPKLGDYIILSVNDGVVAPPPDVKLEPWEVWEARAEVAGFGA